MTITNTNAGLRLWIRVAQRGGGSYLPRKLCLYWPRTKLISAKAIRILTGGCTHVSRKGGRGKGGELMQNLGKDLCVQSTLSCSLCHLITRCNTTLARSCSGRRKLEGSSRKSLMPTTRGNEIKNKGLSWDSGVRTCAGEVKIYRTACVHTHKKITYLFVLPRKMNKSNMRICESMEWFCRLVRKVSYYATGMACERVVLGNLLRHMHPPKYIFTQSIYQRLNLCLLFSAFLFV